METEKTEFPLRDYLDKQGITMSQFSRASGIPISTIFYIYHGQRKASRAAAIKICKASGRKLSLDDFGIK